MIKIALNHFKDFLKDQYPVYEFSIMPELITKDMMEHFVEYIQSRRVGEGAQSIYQRFKKVLRYAIDHEVMQERSLQRHCVRGRQSSIAQRCTFDE